MDGIIKKVKEDSKEFINGLTYEEKIILLFAIMSNGVDGLYLFIRNSKYKDLSQENIGSLLKKLGVSEEEIKEME